MKIYKNLSIFKNDSVECSKPTHTVIATDKDYQNKVTIASLWTKDGAKGKFLSGLMKNEYKSDKGTLPGYVIVQEDELNALIAKVELTDLQKINNENANKLVGRDMTMDEHEAMEGLVF